MKETYVPSPFTLTFLENFATRKVQLRSQKSNISQHCRQEASLVPDFAIKNKKAFDKQNLLEQVRQQKIRYKQMSASNVFMKRQLSQSKCAALSKFTHLQTPAKGISPSLKRQIEQLVQQIEQNNQLIVKIKTSKKYNRFIELQTAKQVYLQQIKQLQKKIAENKYALNEQKRIVKQQRKRQKDMLAMNKAIQINIMNSNNLLIQQIQTLDEKIRVDSQKELTQKREKKRLYEEILQLQRLTGKFYLVQKDEEQQQAWFNPKEQQKYYQSLKQPPMLFEKEPILKDFSEEQQQQEQQDEQQYSFQDQDSHSTQKSLKKQNQSF